MKLSGCFLANKMPDGFNKLRWMGDKRRMRGLVEGHAATGGVTLVQQGNDCLGYQ